MTHVSDSTSRAAPPPSLATATDGLRPGSVAWTRSLLAWWTEQPTRDTPSLVTTLTFFGYGAEEVSLVAPDGSPRTVVRVKFGEGSETTRGWAVLDPTRGRVYTAPDGRMAHPEQLRDCPDWVAAERIDESGRNGTSTPDWMFWAHGPRAINFQIGDACNMHCVMCWQDRRRAHQPREQWHSEMPASRVRDVLERHLSDIDTVELVSFGETMANPEFDEMVHVIEALGDRRGRPFRLHLITNGSLLHPAAPHRRATPAW